MERFQRKTTAEIRQLSVDEFCDYIEEWNKASEEKWQNQEATDIPTFSSIDEARKYYGAITLEEFEKKYLINNSTMLSSNSQL